MRLQFFDGAYLTIFISVFMEQLYMSPLTNLLSWYGLKLRSKLHIIFLTFNYNLSEHSLYLLPTIQWHAMSYSICDNPNTVKQVQVNYILSLPEFLFVYLKICWEVVGVCFWAVRFILVVHFCLLQMSFCCQLVDNKITTM